MTQTTTQTKTEILKKQAEDFLLAIDVLTNGERAALKKSAGVPLQAAKSSALLAFYKCLPYDIESWKESRFFAIGCMACLWGAGDWHGDPLEKIVSDLIQINSLSESTQHKVINIMDSRWDDEDGYLSMKLTRLLKMIHQKVPDQKVSFPSLLCDFVYWNNDMQLVQKKWAKSICTGSSPKNK